MEKIERLEGSGSRQEVAGAYATEAEANSMVSVTDLTSYMYCPKLLYRQKVFGYEEKPTPAMVLGAIRHNFHDLANKYEERIVIHLPAAASGEETAAAYTATYTNLLRMSLVNNNNRLLAFGLAPEDVMKKMHETAVAEAQERAENVYKFAAAHNVFGEELWERLTPKILTELKVKSVKLQLKGAVDRVEVYPDAVLPVELKTGKIPGEGVWPAHRVQVAAYMMLLQEKFNTQVNRAVIRYLDHSSSRTVVLNPYMELEVKELTENVIRLMESRVIPKPCGRERCSCAR